MTGFPWPSKPFLRLWWPHNYQMFVIIARSLRRINALIPRMAFHAVDVVLLRKFNSLTALQASKNSHKIL
jgi:hypothetical protein